MPLATTQSTLIPSINKGIKLFNDFGGFKSETIDVGMTKTVIIQVDKNNLHDIETFLYNNHQYIHQYFNEVSKYAKLKQFYITTSGNNIFIKFICSTGDALGINMIDRGINNVLKKLLFNQMLSSNEQPIKGGSNEQPIKGGSNEQPIKGSLKNHTIVCDILPNKWISNRGKYVITTAFATYTSIKSILKTYSNQLWNSYNMRNDYIFNLTRQVDNNTSGTTNVIAGIFAATGQELANINSNSFLQLEDDFNCKGESGIKFTLLIPSLEIGLINNGSQLITQKSCWKNIMRVNNSIELANIIGATCLANEVNQLALNIKHA